MRASPVPPDFSARAWQGALVRGLGEVFGPRFCPPFSRYGRRLFLSFAGAAGGGWGSSLKNGVFLTVPENQNSANAAKTPRAATFSRLPLVRQAAKGGVILAFRGCKKYHRFFQWSPKHPAAPVKEANSRRPYQEKGGQNRGPNTPPKPLANASCRPRRRSREGRGTT